jgi:preprotein translocase subunit SecA
MGRMKAWYQEIVEADRSRLDFDYEYDQYNMTIIDNSVDRRPLTVDEINRAIDEAGKMDYADVIIG